MQCWNSSFQKASFSGWLMAAIFSVSGSGTPSIGWPTVDLGMNREGLGAAAELGFVLLALQADQGHVVQVELGMLEHLDDAALLAAPADDGQLRIRMGAQDDLQACRAPALWARLPVSPALRGALC